MNKYNLVVDLEPRDDKKGNIYYIGRLKAPISIDLDSGVTLLVFISESGDEELQIAVNDKENITFSKFTKKKDRLEIKLDGRTDQHGHKFFVAKLQMNGNIKCHDEIVFLIFTSREGSEEIQIVGGLNTSPEKTGHRGIEVIRKRSFISD